MPYSGPYSLGTRCMTEFLGTAMAIFLGDSVIANELLPQTKGHGMGFGWIATSFGMSFGVSIIMFGYASAHINPAMALALWLIGRLSTGDFFAIAAAEIAGGFIGAVGMYITYLPHFRTVPEPKSNDEDSPLLRTRDTIDASALRIASYNTKSSPSEPPRDFAQRLNEAKYYLTSENTDPEQLFNILSVGTLDLAGVEVAFPKTDLEAAPSAAAVTAASPANADQPHRPIQRRHSIQVAEMQRRLRQLESSLDSTSAATLPSGDAATQAPIVMQVGDDLNVKPTTKQQQQQQQPAKRVAVAEPSTATLSRMTRSQALQKAAIKADQAAKLSAFCNRPAIYLPIHNYLVELIGTLVLILGALLLDDRFASAKPAAAAILGSEAATLVFENGLAPFLIAIFIQVCILSLGGPTGFTANPARDLGPRFAHWVLPIPGKGKSEWNYSLYVNAGALSGGALAGLLYMGIKQVRDNHL
ncbi:aquaporin-like protein [Entophlyctis helioformis]|nr:aquaporin-like protein [Entophlyctis helioformis]